MSITHLQLAGTLKQLAAHLAEEVEVPIGTSCCGTAQLLSMEFDKLGRELEVDESVRIVILRAS